MRVEKVYGAPGTGKTTYLMNKVVEELKNGCTIDDVAFIGFTRAACNEALHRAALFANISEKERHWFMTIHATCLKLLVAHGMYSDRTVGTYADMKEFCSIVGLEPPRIDDDAVEGGQISTGTAFFSTHTYVTNTFMDVKEWKRCPHATVLKDYNYPRLHDQWHEYKLEKGIVDFNDMLLDALSMEVTPDVKVLFVDEFQDISPLQKAIAVNFGKGKERIYVAGDDDQALYGFQGADPKLMLEFPADAITVLERSYRCSDSVWKVSQELIARNVNRQQKIVCAREATGHVYKLYEPSWSDFSGFLDPSKKVYMLLRTNWLVSKLSWYLANTGVPFRYLDHQKDKLFGWTREKVDACNKVCGEPTYYRKLDMINRLAMQKGWISVKRDFVWKYASRGIRINPGLINLHIGTIHSAKGREADTVLVFNDITGLVLQGMELDPEAERRVWYVAMTRAKDTLVLIDGFFGQYTNYQTYREIGRKDNGVEEYADSNPEEES